MMEVAAERGVSSHIHLRPGIEGVEEATFTAVETGAALHIVHVNSGGGAKSADFMERIGSAVDAGNYVTTEAYPYEAGMTI